MKSPTKILYIVLLVVYTFLSFKLFPELNSNVVIPSIPLLAIGAWIYGTSGGLIVILYLLSASFVLSQTYGDIYIYFMDRATGVGTYLAVVYVFGSLRNNFDKIREINLHLDQMVNIRKRELTQLTARLLNNTETRRMQLGQQLHDGIGQQLTGIKLLATSLEHQLQTEKSAFSELGTSLVLRSSHIHNQFRSIARSLFPIRITQVGLGSALNEMASCLNEIRGSKISIKELASIEAISETTSLELYRMCQESCTYLLEYGAATEINIRLLTERHSFTVEIEHNGQLPQDMKEESLLNLVQYRVKDLSGKMTSSTTYKGRPIIYFQIPKPEEN